MMSSFEIGSIISSPNASYEIKDFLGSGTTGQVFLCQKTINKVSNIKESNIKTSNRKTTNGKTSKGKAPNGKTSNIKKSKSKTSNINTSNTEASDEEYVALKVYKSKQDTQLGIGETRILQMMRINGGEDHNIVRLHDSFVFSGQYCMEFEHLDISLKDFLNKSKQLSLMQIRQITKQVATALVFLKKMGLIHGDMKPANIMLVNHTSSLQVKLIDFGLAHMRATAARGHVIQTSWYRAPEVYVGSWYSESIDVWSLGCIAVEMLLGRSLFSGSCTADMMRHIVKTVGMPPAFVLSHGVYTEELFQLDTDHEISIFKFRADEKKPQFNPRTLRTLEDLYNMDRTYIEDYSQDKATDYEYFVNLVCQMVEVNPERRVSAEDVLQHPFITMSHIQGVFDTDYVWQCVEMMHSRPEHLLQVQEEQPSTSKSCLRPAQTHTLQRSLEEQTGAHGSRPREDQRKCDAKTKHIPVKKKVRFAIDLSDSSQSLPSAHSPPQREASVDSHRSSLVIKRATRFPFPQVDSSTPSSDSSGSRKRLRNLELEEETEAHGLTPEKKRTNNRSATVLVPGDEEQASSQTRPELSGGTRRRRREEGKERRSAVRKRSRSPPRT